MVQFYSHPIPPRLGKIGAEDFVNVEIDTFDHQAFKSLIDRVRQYDTEAAKLPINAPKYDTNVRLDVGASELVLNGKFLSSLGMYLLQANACMQQLLGMMSTAEQESTEPTPAPDIHAHTSSDNAKEEEIMRPAFSQLSRGISPSEKLMTKHSNVKPVLNKIHFVTVNMKTPSMLIPMNICDMTTKTARDLVDVAIFDFGNITGTTEVRDINSRLRLSGTLCLSDGHIVTRMSNKGKITSMPLLNDMVMKVTFSHYLDSAFASDTIPQTDLRISLEKVHMSVVPQHVELMSWAVCYNIIDGIAPLINSFSSQETSTQNQPVLAQTPAYNIHTYSMKLDVFSITFELCGRDAVGIISLQVEGVNAAVDDWALEGISSELSVKKVEIKDIRARGGVHKVLLHHASPEVCHVTYSLVRKEFDEETSNSIPTEQIIEVLVDCPTIYMLPELFGVMYGVYSDINLPNFGPHLQRLSSKQKPAQSKSVDMGQLLDVKLVMIAPELVIVEDSFDINSRVISMLCSVNARYADTMVANEIPNQVDKSSSAECVISGCRIALMKYAHAEQLQRVERDNFTSRRDIAHSEGTDAAVSPKTAAMRAVRNLDGSTDSSSLVDPFDIEFTRTQKITGLTPMETVGQAPEGWEVVKSPESEPSSSNSTRHISTMRPKAASSITIGPIAVWLSPAEVQFMLSVLYTITLKQSTKIDANLFARPMIDRLLDQCTTPEAYVPPADVSPSGPPRPPPSPAISSQRPSQLSSPSQNRSSDGGAPNEVVFIQTNGIEIVLVNPIKKSYRPFMEITVSALMGSVTDAFQTPELLLEGQVSIDWYDPNVLAWEPVLDPWKWVFHVAHIPAGQPNPLIEEALGDSPVEPRDASQTSPSARDTETIGDEVSEADYPKASKQSAPYSSLFASEEVMNLTISKAFVENVVPMYMTITDSMERERVRANQKLHGVHATSATDLDKDVDVSSR
jgi:hypothetical protein